MNTIDFNKIHSAASVMASHIEQMQEFARKQEEIENSRRFLEQMVATSPTATPLKELVETIQEQNSILLGQLELLKEENERQKEQIEESKLVEKQAKKEARNARVFAWLTFGVATLLSLAALIVSIISII